MTRVLFFSSVIDGGSPHSQRALAHHLIERGHDVEFLVDDQRNAPVSRLIGEQFADASVRFGRSNLLGAAASIPGGRPRSRAIDELSHWTSPHPHNALKKVIDDFAPDIVIGNSVDRHSWRCALKTCRARGVRTILYLREMQAIGHLKNSEDPADTLVANARTLVSAAAEQGHQCEFVPSVIDVSTTRTESSRSTALLINPVASHGVNLGIELARRCPGIPFTFQESWPLKGDERHALDHRLQSFDNIEFRPQQDPGPDLYSSARVLLVPHRLDNRPRVIVEAQDNGIPAITSAYSGLREAAGDEALVIHEDDVDAWTEALLQIWEDQDYYDELVTRAYRAASRPELDPDKVVDSFETIMEHAISRPALTR